MENNATALLSKQIEVQGTVQGVGFRPTIARLARQRKLRGYVRNTRYGVEIVVQGPEDAVGAFEQFLQDHDGVKGLLSQTLPTTPLPEFHIQETLDEGEATPWQPTDLRLCGPCQGELFDQTDRRFRYPFISCTACGPRFSILKATPFDRGNTSLDDFPMCATCNREYEEPANRRFHAQTICCPDCGPKIQLDNHRGQSSDAAIKTVTHAIQQGAIVAVLGVGGFQLWADPKNKRTINRLRAAKDRPHKPLALMTKNLQTAKALVHLDAAARAQIDSAAGPIVLAPRRDTGAVTASVAPGQPDLGVMLAANGLHHLLLEGLQTVVATSANLQGEPIYGSKQLLEERLGHAVDHILGHDLQIQHPIDDSVVRIVDQTPLPLRVCRGYAPVTVALESEPTVALGGHQKNTVAVADGAFATVSPHIGDLDGPQTRALQRATLEALMGARREAPLRVACDQHPDYASSHLAHALSESPVQVQHHCAHIAAVMAEHQIDGPVLGVAWDGAGAGTDHQVWGGEFLIVHRGVKTRRFAHLRPFRLLCGERAFREPRLAWLAIMDALGLQDTTEYRDLIQAAGPFIEPALQRGLNSPLSSSAGRLFDAASALLGLCSENTFEGRAAMALETCARKHAPRPYALASQGPDDAMLDWGPLFVAMRGDRDAGIAPAEIAMGFHQALANSIVTIAQQAQIPRVALAGGCFQNPTLLSATRHALQDAEFLPVVPRILPPNDAALALGQLWVASHIPLL